MVKRVVVIPAGPPVGQKQRRGEQRRMGLARRVASRRTKRKSDYEPERRSGLERRIRGDRRRRLERRIGLDIGAVLAEIEL